jgi:hypothetical protein
MIRPRGRAPPSGIAEDLAKTPVPPHRVAGDLSGQFPDFEIGAGRVGGREIAKGTHAP